MDEAERRSGERFEIAVEADRTVVDVTGGRDAAVVVRSASGERIYLPPPNAADPSAGERRSPYESPDDGAGGDATPYASSYGATGAYGSPGGATGAYGSPGDESRAQGLTPTADGFRIVHPEPATDVRVLRGGDHSESTSR